MIPRAPNRSSRIEAVGDDLPPGPLTYEQFLAWAGEDTRAEWVNGEVVRTMPGNLLHQLVEELLLIIVGFFVRRHELGLAIHEFSMKLPESGRVPDLLFTRNPPDDERATHVVGAADLAVEIVSPESIERDRQDKPVEYAEGGVGEYWIADLIEGTPHFLQRDYRGRLVEVFPDADGIYESRVLPGLKFPARWLISPPNPAVALEQLGLAYRGERYDEAIARAEAAEIEATIEQRRAAAERVRAEAERARADQLAEQLRRLQTDRERDS